jgi:hypothetical protein
VRCGSRFSNILSAVMGQKGGRHDVGVYLYASEARATSGANVWSQLTLLANLQKVKLDGLCLLATLTDGRWELA